MDSPSLEQRLSQISTQWTLLFAAHGEAGQTHPSGQAARAQLAQRYCGAVYRYLLAAVRDPDVAADLSQDFALRFLQGDFRRAAPERGRFRSYLKTALFNLVADYRRGRQAAARPLAHDIAQPHASQAAHLDPSSEELEFARSWRETLLARTWRALEEANATYHAALKLRVSDPEMTSAEMAVRIARETDKPMNAAAARKAVERGHQKFADLLLDEVAATLDDPRLEEIEAELRELDLLRYCKSAIARRRQRST
jgi:RNA polymerase sigma-70 factor (ECF subfamily)